MVSVQEATGCDYAVATRKMGYNDEVQFQSGVARWEGKKYVCQN